MTESYLLLKETFNWSKINRVVNHSVNMGVVEIQVGNFSGNFEQLVDRATLESLNTTDLDQ